MPAPSKVGSGGNEAAGELIRARAAFWPRSSTLSGLYARTGYLSQLCPLRQTIQKQCRFLAWCAFFHCVETIGPVRIFTIRSQSVNPASSAIRMKSQCGHLYQARSKLTHHPNMLG